MEKTDYFRFRDENVVESSIVEGKAGSEALVALYTGHKLKNAAKNCHYTNDTEQETLMLNVVKELSQELLKENLLKLLKMKKTILMDTLCKKVCRHASLSSFLMNYILKQE